MNLPVIVVQLGGVWKGLLSEASAGGEFQARRSAGTQDLDPLQTNSRQIPTWRLRFSIQNGQDCVTSLTRQTIRDVSFIIETIEGP